MWLERSFFNPKLGGKGKLSNGKETTMSQETKAREGESTIEIERGEQNQRLEAEWDNSRESESMKNATESKETKWNLTRKT